MGLDMYLSASKYIGNWDHNGEKERKEYDVISKAVGLPGFNCEGSPHLTVKMCVLYWRKANQIHKWFVDNVQDGEDDCEHSSVSREQLEELRALCQKTIESKNPNLLPTQPGFFFGSTDIDDYYYEDLRHTADQLKVILENPVLKESWCFDYQSSW